MKYLQTILLVIGLFIMINGQSFRKEIADGTADVPQKYSMQPKVEMLSADEISAVKKAALESEIVLKDDPKQMSSEESNFKKDFEILDVAEGFFVMREMEYQAYLYTAYSPKMKRNYQGIIVFSISNNGTKFTPKAHYAYNYRGDKYLRQLSDINGNFLSELAIFSEPPSKKLSRKTVRIIEFSPDGLQKIGLKEIYTVKQTEWTNNSIRNGKTPATKIYRPRVDNAVKLYSKLNIGKSVQFYAHKWSRKGDAKWMMDEKEPEPTKMDEDLTEYLEVLKPAFPLGPGSSQNINEILSPRTEPTKAVLVKNKSCYRIVYAEPFEKKERDKIYLSEFHLVDICPEREAGVIVPSSTVKINRDGKDVWVDFDPILTFANKAEAKKFADKHGIKDESMMLN